MALVELVAPEAASADVIPILESGRAQYGTVLATWRALLHRPTIFATYLPYLRAVAGPGDVSQRTKDLSALQVALLNHCRYSTSHRAGAARASGASEAHLAALARGDMTPFSAEERVAIEYATQLTMQPPVVDFHASRQGVEADLLRRVRDAFTDPQIVELTASICLWNALSRFHRVMDFELDMPPPPAALEEVL